MQNENLDNMSVISQEISQRNPQQFLYQQQSIKTVDINQIIQEYASHPSEIFKFYSQNNRDTPQKTLVSQVESLVFQFAQQNRLTFNSNLCSQQIEEIKLNIKQFQNLLKLALTKDNDPVLQSLCLQSPSIKEYVQVVCDPDFIQFKLGQFQNRLDFLLEQQSLGLKYFMLSKDFHNQEDSAILSSLVSCSAKNKCLKKRQQAENNITFQKESFQQ